MSFLLSFIFLPPPVQRITDVERPAVGGDPGGVRLAGFRIACEPIFGGIGRYTKQTYASPMLCGFRKAHAPNGPGKKGLPGLRLRYKNWVLWNNSMSSYGKALFRSLSA